MDTTFILASAILGGLVTILLLVLVKKAGQPPPLPVEKSAPDVETVAKPKAAQAAPKRNKKAKKAKFEPHQWELTALKVPYHCL